MESDSDCSAEDRAEARSPRQIAGRSYLQMDLTLAENRSDSGGGGGGRLLGELRQRNIRKSEIFGVLET